METRSKTITVEVGDARYQVRRLAPDVGSYIWQRLQFGAYKGAMAVLRTGQEPGGGQPEKSAADVQPLTIQDRLRALCGGAFMCMDYADFQFVQLACMKAITRLELNAGQEMPVPLVMEDGRWVLQDVADDPALVTRLMVEAVVFNMVPFLEERNGKPTA